MAQLIEDPYIDAPTPAPSLSENLLTELQDRLAKATAALDALRITRTALEHEAQQHANVADALHAALAKLEDLREAQSDQETRA